VLSLVTREYFLGSTLLQHHRHIFSIPILTIIAGLMPVFIILKIKEIWLISATLTAIILIYRREYA
jgi:hypothetical protein